jgi:hypothetical protein
MPVERVNDLAVDDKTAMLLRRPSSDSHVSSAESVTELAMPMTVSGDEGRILRKLHVVQLLEGRPRNWNLSPQTKMPRE